MGWFNHQLEYSWQFCERDLFGMVTVSDHLFEGIKGSRLESPGWYPLEVFQDMFDPPLGVWNTFATNEPKRSTQVWWFPSIHEKSCEKDTMSLKHKKPNGLKQSEICKNILKSDENHVFCVKKTGFSKPMPGHKVLGWWFQPVEWSSYTNVTWCLWYVGGVCVCVFFSGYHSGWDCCIYLHLPYKSTIHVGE